MGLLDSLVSKKAFRLMIKGFLLKCGGVEYNYNTANRCLFVWLLILVV